MAEIIIALGDATVKTVVLTAGELTVGRAPSCDIHLDDKTVSRRHARFTFSNRGLVVEDLDSRNGTYVSGRQIGRHVVVPGDVVTIGPYSITFRDLPLAAEEARFEEENQSGETLISALDAASISRAEDVKQGLVSAEAATRRLTALYDLGQRLSGRLEASEIADAFLDTVFEVFPKIDRAIVLLEDRFSHDLVPIAVRPQSTSGEIRVSRTVIGTVLKERQAVVCSDTLRDERFKGAVSLQDLRVRAVMCAPLLVGDRVIGMVELDSERGLVFGDDDLRLLIGLASQVSIAVDNGRLYEEIEQSRRLAAIGQTVSSVAHCIKNVLNGIEGGLFIAKKGLENSLEDKIAKGWGMLERNAAFLKTLVLDMLDYSKQRPPEYEDVEVRKLLGEIEDFVSGRAAKGQIELTVDVDSSLGNVKLDPTRMKRALLNIVANAIEATEPGGKVSIRARACGDHLTITISDTGSGIPEDKLRTIFEPFFSTKGSKGTGLGLPVTKKIIEEHSGRIEVKSQPGKGTTFEISLPIT